MLADGSVIIITLVMGIVIGTYAGFGYGSEQGMRDVYTGKYICQKLPDGKTYCVENKEKK